MNKRRKYNLLPSVSSYQGRYFYLAVTVILVLVAIALFGNRYVDNLSWQQIVRISDRTIVEEHLIQVRKSLSTLENWIYQQLLEPGSVELNQGSGSLIELKNNIHGLADAKLQIEDAALPDLLSLLSTEAEKLGSQIETFITHTEGIRNRFPITSAMEENMLPQAESVQQLLNLVIQNLSDTDDSTEMALLSAAYELRLNWEKLVSEFRLLIANRFGVFSDTPLVGINARLNNLKLYIEQFNSNLNKTKTFLKPEQLPVGGEDTWDEIERSAEHWLNNYQVVADYLTQPNWRQDLYYFNTEIKPTLEAIRDKLAVLETHIGGSANKDVKFLTLTAGRLSHGINLLSLLGLVLIVTAYFYTRQKIILPIAETTRALKLEARGDRQEHIPIPKIQETRDLVDAFQEMRLQVTQRQQGLDYLAYHDSLTSLPNRVLLKDRLDHAIELARRHNHLLSLMFLDLDNFKQVNDSLGHAAGDELLIEIARRLSDSLRSSDTVARLGGDEFAILIEDIGNREQVAYKAEAILAALKAPISLEGHQIHVSASIGIAMAPSDAKNSDLLIRDADTAMYEAKRKGRATFRFFSEDMTRRAMEQLELEQRLRQATAKQEFLFHYQPIVDLKNSNLHSVEALVRWQPPGEPLKYPSEFLTTLLEIGISGEIAPVLLKTVAQLQHKVKQQLGIPLTVSVNISANALRSQQLRQKVISLLQKSGVQTDQLIMEITENTLTSDLAFSTELLTSLRNLGVRIALDDFGTGQSSLNHLRYFSFDIVKIDRQFIRDISTDPADANLIKSIISLSHNFGAKVVAEGVENQDQYEFLEAVGCDYVQGYKISKPLPADELMRYLDPE